MFGLGRRKQKKWMKYVGTERSNGGGGSCVHEKVFGAVKVSIWAWSEYGQTKLGATLNFRQQNRRNGFVSWVKTYRRRDINDLGRAVVYSDKYLSQFEQLKYLK